MIRSQEMPEDFGFLFAASAASIWGRICKDQLLQKAIDSLDDLECANEESTAR
jgi:hypothetical protein